MSIRIATIDDGFKAREVIRQHICPAPLFRSYALENALGLNKDRRVWIKDYGWTPVGSYKLMGALYWTHQHDEEIGSRPIAAHSSGNFASGISFAGRQYGKRVIIVMPESAPRIKFAITRSFGAEIRTYDIATDHLTGRRDSLTREIADKENAVQASPYDDADVIAGNAVGAIEIVEEFERQGRGISHFFCQVSGGGLMAGHALGIADRFPESKIIGVEPAEADDFRQSLAEGRRVRLDRPKSICDGLLSYDVGEHNWPIMQKLVNQCVAIDDTATQNAMRWLYQTHGLKTEPSGAIATAAAIEGNVDLSGT
ncbi:MAG: L-threonine dehydratase catabolic TdcB, partial [Planctomycetota bacterium]